MAERAPIAREARAPTAEQAPIAREARTR